MRRKDYKNENIEEAKELLTNIKVGTLATVSKTNTPCIRPMNFVLYDDKICFHGAPSGEKYEHRNQTATFNAYIPLAWIPSYWRDPKKACPATTYYQSVNISGQINTVENLSYKAEILEAFMKKYQPEGGYSTISTEQKMYTGILKGIFIFYIPLININYKCKIGQNLNIDTADIIINKLNKRNLDMDCILADKMDKFHRKS